MFWKLIASTALLLTLMTSGTAHAVQYPPESTTSSSVLGTSTVVATTAPRRVTVVNRPDRVQVSGGKLARTGSSNVANAVRVGVLLMLVGFVIYLVGRRRAVRGQR